MALPMPRLALPSTGISSIFFPIQVAASATESMIPLMMPHAHWNTLTMPLHREWKNGPTVLQLSMMRPAATVTAVNTTPIGPMAKRRATPTRRSPPERTAVPAAQMP